MAKHTALAAFAAMTMAHAPAAPVLAEAVNTQRPFVVQGKAELCDVTIVYGPNDRGASSAAPGGRAAILYDPEVMATLPYLDPFVFAHECGHHALDHTSMAGLLREGHLFETKELAADCWGARALVAAGQTDALRAQLAIFRSMSDQRPGPRYPSFGTRADHMEACAFGDGAGIAEGE